jgi:ABC-type transport system involved in multi-copper enzyme maturation permease subunit
MRSFYVGALLLSLYLVYASWFGWDGHTVRIRATADGAGEEGYGPGIHEMAQFANSMATTFLWVQFLAVFLLTPILTAGAISEERGRRTLDFLLVTHLHDSEIVVGKLAARLSHMVLILASGLPLLGILQLLGGVDANLVLAAFVCTLAFLIGLGSLAVFASASAPNTRQAVARTYYLCLCYCLGSMFCLPFGSWLDWVADGNPVVFLTRELGDMRPAAQPRGLPVAVVHFTVFHAVAAFLLCFLAVQRLRRPLDQLSRRQLQILCAERGPSKAVTALAELEPRHRPMPDDVENPLWWKECTFEMAGPLRSWDVFVLTLIMCLTSCISLGPLIVFSMDQRPNLAAESSNVWVRGWSAFLSTILLSGVALNAAARFSRERSRRTLDSLLATPLENRTILAAKILGSIATLRWFCAFLGIFLVIGVLTFSMSLLAFPLVLGAWTLYAFLAALIGVGFSLVCRNTMRATMFTLITLIGLCVGPLLLGLAVESVARSGDWLEAETRLVTWPIYRLSPPVNLWHLPFNDRLRTTDSQDRTSAREGFLASGFGLAFAASLACFLWMRLNSRFGSITGRMPVNEGDPENRHKEL